MKGAARALPAVFVGHGSPMNAIEDNEFHRGWAQAARLWPRPRAILCVSAHWETRGTAVSAGRRPETIHDFYGFPKALFDVTYEAPGDPVLAKAVASMIKGAKVALDEDQGLDHGAWSVLRAMYPKADVPVVQLSLDVSRPASFHYGLGAELSPLREQGVLVLGSGNMVHNLMLMQYRSMGAFGWAERINAALKARIAAGENDAVVAYEKLDKDMELAVPTPEHFLPLLYVLALKRPGESVAFFNDRAVMGSMSMTCVQIG